MSRRRFLMYGAATAASAAGAGFPVRALAASGTPRGAAGALPAVVSPAAAQTMQGFGAAGAWWPNDLVKYGSTVQNEVGDLLFGKSGIQLSVYRYNIGGGGVGVNNPPRAAETFLTASGGYDWNRDKGGRLFLQMASQQGVPVLIGFVNSAPIPWTTNSQNCGGSLKPGSEWAYGGYLTDVAAHFRSQGVTLSYISPMNEPDYTFAGGSQEGMAVPPWQRAVVAQAAGRQLEQRALYCRLIADESSHVGDQFNPELPRWLTVPGTAQYVAYLAHHVYDFPSDLNLQLARRLGQLYGKTLWCTEICCIDSRTGKFGQQYDPTIAGAMPLANLICQCLTQANDASFHWWLACSSAMGTDPIASPGSADRVNFSGWNDGLLYYAPQYAGTDKQAIYTTKRFYAMGNFSRYVRPGDQRHDVSGGPSNLRIVAFSTSTGWSVVVTNNSVAGAPATQFQVQLPALPWPGALTVTEAVETSASKSLRPGGAPAILSRVLSGTVPAQSITTYVLKGSG